MPSDSLAPPQRSGSIKRTPSDLSKELAAQDLPEPEYLRERRARDDEQRKLDEKDRKLESLEGEEPEGESPPLHLAR